LQSDPLDDIRQPSRPGMAYFRNVDVLRREPEIAGK
jgi:hypothetical protein